VMSAPAVVAGALFVANCGLRHNQVDDAGASCSGTVQTSGSGRPLRLDLPLRGGDPRCMRGLLWDSTSVGSADDGGLS
jgi:hypothetical protein